MSAPRTPLNAFNAAATAFLSVHAGTDTRAFVRNVGARVEPLESGGIHMPVTVSAGGRGDAWIVSPRTTYGAYAGEELRRLGRPVLQTALGPVVASLDAAIAASGLDDCVCINNWLVSTNGYPPLPDSSIARLVAGAQARWPDRALWFRSLNEYHDGAWLRALRALGAHLVPSRQVYLFDDVEPLARRHADVAKDFALLRRSAVALLDPAATTDADYARAAHLYALLYLRKYSRLNPDYTPALLRAWHRAGLLELHGLRSDSGDLVAVVGMLAFGRLITSPIVGYDTDRPIREGLYRLLAATVLERARRLGRPVNLSAGVAHFKRQRGGVPAIEYSAVIADRAPLRTRAALAMLGGLTRTIGVPVMRKFRL